MSCCGKTRELARNVSINQPRPSQPQRTVFQYHGLTAMIMIGPVSGKVYRFNGPGASLEVDPRDRMSLAAVPNLRRTT
jgi:hypothetical protein